TNPWLQRAAIGALLPPPASCKPPGPPSTAPPPKAPTMAPGTPPLSPQIAQATADAAAGMPTTQEKLQAHIYRGTGVLIKGQPPAGTAPAAPPPVQPSAGGVVLNFEGADLRDVVRTILGGQLGETYTIDPAVGG